MAIAQLMASSDSYPLTSATVYGNPNDTINAGSHKQDWYFALAESEITPMPKSNDSFVLCQPPAE